MTRTVTLRAVWQSSTLLLSHSAATEVPRRTHPRPDALPCPIKISHPPAVLEDYFLHQAIRLSLAVCSYGGSTAAKSQSAEVVFRDIE